MIKSINHSLREEYQYMSKKFFMIASVILLIAGVGGFLVWAFLIAENKNGIIPLEGNETIAYTFLTLCLIGMVTTGISISADKEKGNKVSKKAVISGLAIAVSFFLWRLAVAL